ncbi:MAG: exodeoxyribonuclease VII small subunit [Planctomycetaceae bacterium]
MAKRKSQTDASKAEDPASGSVSIEAAMEELGEIVARLESGKESLDDSLQSFERGMTLLRQCHRRLDGAAQRIEIVTRLGDSPEEIETESFDGSSSLNRTETGTASSSNPKSGAKKNKSSEDANIDDDPLDSAGRRLF